MIAQFKVVPIGKGESLSPYVAECVKIVQASGLKYQLTPMATVLEGEWDDVMDVIGQCHRKVRSMSRRVVTNIDIDDREGKSNAMEQKIKSVQDRLASR
ncbi:MAG TPA: MTH1187 family thiamine-binding protein [Methanomassiliicoccales archaeon]|nr:MTH1187 family thiamine-binding protein [Methanomassiliicoccales archaeon]